jgi:hypothetical protein
MIAFDWMALGLGAGLGLVAGAMFFAGLAWGVRVALRQARPGPVLLASAALRIAALLALGGWIAAQGASALAGFALAFLAVRVAIVALVRPAAPGGGAPWI